MASIPEEDLCCPICQDIFKDPVVLTCSHSFCRDCLQNWWAGDQLKVCPVCRRRSSRTDPPRNLALKNLCETFVQQRDQRSAAGSDALCSLHGEKLKLFCLNHREPVCVVCRDSKTHNKHRFRPIDEAVQDHREELQKSLRPFKKELKLFRKVKRNCEKSAEHLKAQAKSMEEQIKKQFEKLHECLKEEEEDRISNVRDEEAQNVCVMEKKIEGLNREIAALSKTIRVTEEQLRAGDVAFLQNYKAAARRVQRHPLQADPEMASGALMDEAKHLGNLASDVWNSMRKIQTFPVILDPNTAHPELILSEDLTSVRRSGLGRKQKLPDNPERFDSSLSVLGSKGFDSGTHSWAVEVAHSAEWSLGAAAVCGKKKGKMEFNTWRIRHSGCLYEAFSPSASTILGLSVKKPERVKVHLDFEGGKLTFTHLDTKEHIHTFTHTFTRRMFPYIQNGDEGPVRIIPKGDDGEDDDDDDQGALSVPDDTDETREKIALDEDMPTCWGSSFDNSTDDDN